MPLRIAFDMDGVLADMEGELARQAERLFGTIDRRLSEPPPAAAPLPAEERPDSGPPAQDALPALLTLKLTSRQEQRLWRHVATIDGFWESLGELEPGVIPRLHTLATKRRWEIVFLTKRPPTAGATAQRQTQRWLQAKGFDLPSVYVVQGSRGRIAAAFDLDFVIDDRPENCLDVVAESKARAILVWRTAQHRMPEAAQRLGIGVVPSVDRCLDILAEIGPTQSGVMARVLRLLGLKEPARV